MKSLATRLLSMVLAAVMAVTLLPEAAFLKEEKAVTKVKAAETELSNPRIVTDDTGTMQSGQKVTWDCVWFGSYPQTEVVSEEDTSKITALEKMNTYYDTEYEKISSSKFSQIENASYDSNGDATVGTEKYRRIKFSDVTYAQVTDDSYQYRWNSDYGYRYFKYEPIKWRVLNVKDGEVLLLADVALDDQQYNTTKIDITWEKSTIRSFLNNYESSENTVGKDYSSKGFLNNAFNTSERSAIPAATLINADNSEYGTKGGNNTSDKVFLLSESDVCSTDIAASCGFAKDSTVRDEARRSKFSTYAFAMGACGFFNDIYNGSCVAWQLRTPGNSETTVAASMYYGGINNKGYSVKDNKEAVRPALYLNLSATSQYSLAGTVCSDGTVDENASPGSGEKDPENPDSEDDLPKILSISANNTDDDGYITGYNTDAVIDISGSVEFEEGYTKDSYKKAWDAVTWTSSDESVVTVGSGSLSYGLLGKPYAFRLNVIPKGIGTATITVAGGQDGDASAEFTVKVKKDTEGEFNLSIYRADYLLNNGSVTEEMENCLLNRKTPGTYIYEAAKKGGLMTASEAYTEVKKIIDAVDSPSSVLDASLTQKDVYEGALLAMMEQTASASSVLTDTQEWSSDVSDLFSGVQKTLEGAAHLEIKGSGQLDLSSLTDEDVAKIQEVTENYLVDNTGYKIAKSQAKKFGTLAKSLKYFTDLYEYSEYVMQCVNLWKLGDDYTEVFRQMYNDCDEKSCASYDDYIALKLALKDCVSIMEASQAELIGKMMDRAFYVAGKDVAKAAIDSLVDSMKSAAAVTNPVAVVLWVVYFGADTATNILFAQDETAEQALKIQVYMEIRTCLQSTYRSLRSTYQSGKDGKAGHAKDYLACVDLFYQYLEADCGEADGFTDIVSSSVAGSLAELTGGSSTAELRKYIDVWRVHYRTERKETASGWVYGLETDYPAEYEKYKAVEEKISQTLKRLYNIDCPVDVYIYNKDGNLVGSVVDGKAEVYDDDALTVACVDQKKKIYFYDSEDYTIYCSGTDSGTMHIRVTDYDEDGNAESVRDYPEIAVSDGSQCEIQNITSDTDTTPTVKDESKGTVKPTAQTSEPGIAGCRHSSVEVLAEKVEATCTSNGSEAKKRCRLCGLLVSGAATIEAKGHSFGEWKTVKNATTEEAGLKKRVCSVCGETEEKEIEKLPVSLQLSVTSKKGIALSKKIAAGKTVYLKANLPVKWISGNTRVAKVTASGKLTFAKKAGGKKVVIAAVPKDGSTVMTIRFQCMKGVVKKVAIKGAKSVKAGKSLKLKAKVKASKGANKKLAWTSSNKKYATVSSSGKVKTKKAGKGKKVKITARATDGSNKKKTVTIKIK